MTQACRQALPGFTIRGPPVGVKHNSSVIFEPQCEARFKQKSGPVASPGRLPCPHDDDDLRLARRGNVGLRRVRLLAAALAVVVIVAGLYAQAPAGAPLPTTATANRLVVEKAARTLSLLSGDRVLKTYHVTLGRNPVGAKVREGDGRTPEGEYVIDRRNPRSRFYLALHVSYPGVADRRRAAAQGVSPGGDIMIHGLPNGLGWLGRLIQLFDWTNGCIAVTDREIEEIYRAAPEGTPIEIRR